MRPSSLTIKANKRNIALAVAAVAACFASNLLANTELDVVGGSSDLTAPASYGGTAPTATSDVTFTAAATYSPATFTVGSGLGIGTLNDLSATPITFSGTGPLTLNGGVNAVAPAGANGGNAADQLFVASGASLTDTNTPVVLIATGNFDVIGTASIGGAISGGFGFTKTGGGTLTLNSANSYTGATAVSAGTLVLAGSQTAAVGQITVGNLAGATGTLNIQAGTYPLGANAILLSNGASTTGIINQSAGAVSFTSGNALLVGNSGGTGTYNLSGGSLTTFSSTTRGVILGVNASSSATFNLSGTGVLQMTTGGNSLLEIGRSDSAANSTTDAFNQTGGTATVGILTIGGAAGGSTGVNATFSVTSGTFTANTFTVLGAAGTNAINMTIGGNATVTLPAFPTATTALGAGSTATLTLNGGTLIPLASSTAYMSGLTNAYIGNSGATINTNGLFITVGQALQNAPSATGTLTKTGTGALLLSGTNTYSGGATVSAGILDFQNVNAQPATGITTVAAAGSVGLGVGGANSFTSANIDSLYLNTFPNVTLSSGSGVAIDTTAGNFTYGTSQASSTVPLTKLGSNTLTLSAPTSNTAVLTVDTGTLTLTANNSTRSTSVNGLTTVNSGSILQLLANAGNTTGGISTVLASEQTANQPLIINSGGTLQLRSDSSVTFAGGNNFGGLGSATITIDVNQITAGNNNNTLTLAPAGFATKTTVINVTGGNGYTLALGPVTAGNTTPLTFNPTTANVTLGAVPNTVTTFAKNGAGTLTFTSSDAHTGVTTIGAGTLQIGTGATSGTLAAGAVTDNGNVAFNRSDSVTLANTISGSGSLSQIGSGTLMVTGTNTYTGPTNVSTGILQVGGGATAGNLPNNGNGGAALSNSGSLVFNRSDSILMLGAVSGAGSLNQAGGGTVTLGAPNTYSGSTNITSGTLKLAQAGTNAPAIVNGSFESPAIAANSYTYSGAFNAAQLSSFGWTPSGNNFTTGSGGPALINTSVAWAYTTPYPNGTQALSMQETSNISQSLNFTSPGLYTLTWSAEERANQVNPGLVQLDGATVYNFTAPSSTAFTNYSATVYIATAGSHTLAFAGTTTADQSYALDNITLAAAPAGTLPATTVLNVSGQSAPGGTSGTFDLGGVGQTVAGLTGGGVSGGGTTPGLVTNSGPTSAVLTVTGSGTYSGVVADGANTTGLTKSTGGTLVLSGVNTYTGPTTITGGTVDLKGGSLATGNIAISAGTLQGDSAANPGTIHFNIAGNTPDTFSNFGTLNISNLILALNVTGTQTQNSYTLETGFYQGTAFQAVTGIPAGDSIIYNPSAGTIVLSTTPEPGTLGLIGLASIGLLARRKSRARRVLPK
ncbi:MAG TPA: autotransporter-associated beta strand repeat-containing protein [Tepidisphaeraceae bacterium]|jgi:autotransporter-associated beta strand protein|nr:autotransporter-associated beta strand repeat-containing protein [Tepidisphaeraceae bacterium]